MIATLSLDDLCKYTSRQLNYLFPDYEVVDLLMNKATVALALDRLEYCFQKVSLKHYFDGKEVKFNHLYSDHYVMFLWFLSNSIWTEKGNCSLVNKIYYLNKSLNGLDCMYDTKMPDVFLIFHGSGTMLGKANYSNYFIALQGCTVGSQNGEYPVFGIGASLTANSSVIGKCSIGDRSTIGTRTLIFQKDIPNDTAAIVDFSDGKLNYRKSNKCYAQRFFNVDLKNI